MLTIKSPQYVFCPFCGRQLNTRLEENIQRKYCTSCNWTYYPRMQTSTAAVIITNNQMLMVKRAKEPYKETWMFPAGYVNFGEHPEETVVREVKEETGLTVSKVVFMKLLQSIDDPREPGHFVIFYKVSVNDTSGVIIDKEENSAISWFPISSPPDIGWVTHKEILKDLQKTIIQ